MLTYEMKFSGKLEKYPEQFIHEQQLTQSKATENFAKQAKVQTFMMQLSAVFQFETNATKKKLHWTIKALG